MQGGIPSNECDENEKPSVTTTCKKQDCPGELLKLVFFGSFSYNYPFHSFLCMSNFNPMFHY